MASALGGRYRGDMADAVQITARGPRAACEAAFDALDVEAGGGACSMIEEDEAAGIWRIDAFPAYDDDARQAEALLMAASGLVVTRVRLADADWNWARTMDPAEGRLS